VVAGGEVLDAEALGSVGEASTRLALPLVPRLVRGRGWLPVADLPRVGGTSAASADALVGAEAARGSVAVLGGWLVDPEVIAAAVASTRAAVDRHHREQPTSPGLELTVLAARLGLDAGRAAAVAEQTPGTLVARGRVRDHTHRASAIDDPATTALLAALDVSPLVPPQPDDVARSRALVREGRLVDVNGLVFTPDAVEAARRILADAFTHRDALSVGDARELLGSTRKYVVPLLEWFDAHGVTRRRGDTRIAGPRLHVPLEGQL
jgi:selenocysteine-specific elongation factor